MSSAGKGGTRYFTPSEVAAHNCAEDLWVSFLGYVYDLTPLAKEHVGSPLLQPIVAVAGTDISHWFDETTQDLRKFVDPVTGLELPYTPHGRFVHVPPPCPTTSWATDFGIPWWKDTSRRIGRLSKRTRLIKVTNMLSSQSQTIEVCNEETLQQIESRYLEYNSHSQSYTWKHLGNVLDMGKTLGENGIEELSEEFYKLSIDQYEFVPEIQVYFNDDLTAP
ncbi:cytochrome b5 domain-containing protein 1 [Salpingoeca rosetta]|uniref:Cytochrome b5 domain-containing protein 1 n=1 Tax=Salpingoeca rosetta (strain ATCC 50818 / BSB-021) TaxID=946362 RepID=F2TXY1_SALR5|nr:cytochrome b5 domain-containing protein 1 [Salpingoeca rosetta]EGD76240.1 cytochrome b5 domain-containing protein 1 [Salpingoeca rosetta]|eukprot:XP_004998415.1 cytochrome b5 domain-containing protein 1 [Salpingoeca rosetta]